MSDQFRWEKLGLILLAAVATIAITWIALKALGLKTVDANGATLIGVAVGILGNVVKDIISAIRGYSMSKQLEKVTDQLAASGPSEKEKP